MGGAPWDDEFKTSLVKRAQNTIIIETFCPKRLKMSQNTL